MSPMEMSERVKVMGISRRKTTRIWSMRGSVLEGLEPEGRRVRLLRRDGWESLLDWTSIILDPVGRVPAIDAHDERAAGLAIGSGPDSFSGFGSGKRFFGLDDEVSIHDSCGSDGCTYFSGMTGRDSATSGITSAGTTSGVIFGAGPPTVAEAALLRC